MADVRGQVSRSVELCSAPVTESRRSAASPQRLRQPSDPFEVAVGNGDVEARIVVRRRPEHIEGLGHAEPPRVVRRARDVLEVAPVRLEPVDALAELKRTAVHPPLVSRVADSPPDVVVGSVHQVRRSGMGVGDAPASAEDLPDVRFVVSVAVLQKKHVRRCRDDYAAVGEHQARREVQVVCKDGELVSSPVPVRVFENLDAIVAWRHSAPHWGSSRPRSPTTGHARRS